jgi:hypothetical protein
MQLIRTVIICQECQMPYYKAFWEPMWLANLAAKENHDEWHEMAMHPETTPLAETWRKWERERIIQLIKDKYAEVAKRNGYQFLPEQIEWLENLIKGEQK